MARNPTDTALLPVGYVLGIRVYRGPKTRITLRSIRATASVASVARMEPLCGAIRDGHGTEPNEYRRVARGVWFRVSGFIGARKPGFHFVPSGLRQQVII